MTKQFCDVCGREIWGNHKFDVHLENGKNELDVCFDCRKVFEQARSKADIETYKKLHK